MLGAWWRDAALVVGGQGDPARHGLDAAHVIQPNDRVTASASAAERYGAALETR